MSKLKSVLFLFFVFFSAFLSTKPAFADNYLSLKTSSPADVQVSPDSKTVIYQTETPSADGHHWIAKLWLTVPDKNHSQLLIKNQDISVSNAKWSPDGNWIAYIKQNDDHGSLWLIHPDGNNNHQIFNFTSDCDEFEWSPDNQHIALLGEALQNTKSASASQAIKSINIELENITKNQQLYLLDINSQHITPLTSPDYTVNGDNFTWMPNGKEIIFIKQSNTDNALNYHRSLVKINIETKEVKILRSTPAYYNSPYVSPDGKLLAYQSNASLMPFEHQLSSIKAYAARRLFQVCIISLNNNNHAEHCLPNYFDHYAYIIGWSGDNQSVFLSEDYHTTQRLLEIPTTLSTTKIFNQNYAVYKSMINNNHNTIGFISESASQPPEIYITPISKFKPQKISEINKNISIDNLPKTKLISWQGAQNEKIEGLLTYPINYKPGYTVPLIVAVHGGPDNRWRESYTGLCLVHDINFCAGYLASLGYAVLQPNTHGSTGYGKDFLLSNYKKIGLIEKQDILSGIDFLIKNNIADKTRLGIWGWSYGGFMSSWMTTQTHHFKAAVVGAGVSDWISLQGTSMYNSAQYYFGSQFWNDPKNWINTSPIFHVQNINTPILIQAGDKDHEVPISQSLELYQALKANHKPVKMLVYPDQGHDFHNPAMIITAIEDLAQWFHEHI